MREDIRITMPPHPWCFNGIAEIGPLPVAALVPTGLATGGCCRQWQIGCRPQPATSERHPIRSFGHSSST